LSGAYLVEREATGDSGDRADGGGERRRRQGKEEQITTAPTVRSSGENSDDNL
jgi:hypothetical protein